MKAVTDYEFKAKLHIVEEVPTGYDMAKLEATEAEFDARIDEQVKELIQTYNKALYYVHKVDWRDKHYEIYSA